MASTVSATHACHPPREIRCSRSSSTAPLARIPRQLPSPSSRCISDLVAPLIDPLPSGVIFAHASFPTTLTSPNPSSASAPTPPLAKEDISDGIPPTPQPSTALNLSGHLSKSRVHAPPAVVVAQSVPTPLPPLPRTRSGDTLKSSLKVKAAPSRRSLTIITDSSSSKSAPATLAHKGVRFHSQLEHVKLFLARQKPLAVSRDGNPTDTSGTDSEVPQYSYDDDLKDRSLVMHHIDVPTALPLAEDTRDVAVESVDLVGTTVEGIVRARNLAFEKWIAVRFTLDNWQTTSEVTARYKESLSDGTFDRFVFAIKLADVMSRAEEKTLYLTVRYSVAGREIWDNNSGQNYQVRIAREKASKANKETVTESRGRSSRADDIADLRRKLEQVVKLGLPSETISGILAQESRRRWESPPLTPSPPPRDRTPSFKSEDSLAARYDFAASSRAHPRAPANPSHARENTYPSARPNSVPRPQSQALGAPCGSPRDPPEVSYFSVPGLDCDLDPDDAITLVPSLRSRGSSGFGSRNHTRGGTVGFLDAPSVKRTPPTSPLGSPVSLTFEAFCQV